MVETDYDIIIIGGGPAGLTAGQYSARAGKKTLIVEEFSCGGQMININEVENYPGFDKIPGFELSQNLEQQTKDFGCEIINDQVLEVKKENSKKFDVFSIKLFSQVLTCKAVIIATGCKHRNLDVPGEKEFTGRGVSYCAVCDGPFFKEKKILVCGGGDSAISEALYLSNLTSSLTVCHRRESFRAQSVLVERLKKTGKAVFRMNSKVISINGHNNVDSVTFEDSDGNLNTENFDAVFIFVGNIPRTEVVPFCETDKAGFILTNEKMETSVKGVFSAGDVRATPFRQIVTATSDGAVAAHYASLYIDSKMSVF